MASSTYIRKLLVSATAVATVLAGTQPPGAAAQTRAPSSAPKAPAVEDGEATPAACAALGFQARQRFSDAYVSSPIAPPAPAQRRSESLRPTPLPAPPMVQQREAPPAVMALPAPPPVQRRVEPPSRPNVQNPNNAYMQVAPAPAAGPVGSPESYPHATPNAVKQVATDPVSTFSIDVDTASYANVRRFLNDGQRPPAEAVRVEELVNYFDYGYARPVSRTEPFKPYLAVTPSPWSPGKQLIHIGVQGFAPPKGQEPPLNLVFLVDTSGSMSDADRLPLAQKSLNIVINSLRPQDTVAMVAYAGSAGVVLPPTSGRQRLKMRCAVNALESGGSTAGGAGLSLAYALARQHFDKAAVNRIVMMTDGDFNVGVTNNKRLEDYVSDQRKSGVYLSVYGYGRGNYQDARMQAIAQNGNGTAAYIDGLEEARKVFRDDFDGAMFPIADDVKIQVEFNPARVAEYRLIGYETRMLRREDFNNDAVDAGEVGAGVSVTALYEIAPVGGRTASDPLRYGPAQPKAASVNPAAELAFLKIRYKLPGEQTSHLISQPIGNAAMFPRIEAAPEQTRWAAAVAAYGQKLRGDAYVPAAFSWSDDLALAQGARGQDEYGLRAEFIRLVRAAGEISQKRAGL